MYKSFTAQNIYFRMLIRTIYQKIKLSWLSPIHLPSVFLWFVICRTLQEREALCKYATDGPLKLNQNFMGLTKIPQDGCCSKSRPFKL